MQERVGIFLGVGFWVLGTGGGFSYLVGLEGFVLFGVLCLVLRLLIFRP